VAVAVAVGGGVSVGGRVTVAVGDGRCVTVAVGKDDAIGAERHPTMNPRTTAATILIQERIESPFYPSQE
jgi:hypothetical protein